jgi:hypothetical protein
VNDVIQALAEWRGKSIGDGGLRRRLLGYENWLLPKRPECDIPPFTRFTLPQANLMPDAAGGLRFAVFSDADAVEAFTGQDYGTDGLAYTNPTGWELFATGLGGVASVAIDPGSAHELSIPSADFPALRELAESMEVDEAWQRLRLGDEEEGDMALVARYPRYRMIAIESAAGYVRVTVPHDDGRMFLPLFTHPDAVALALAEFGESFPGEPLKTVEIDGARLFPALTEEDVDGFVFNYRGPGEPVAFKTGILEIVLEELGRD